MLQLPAPIANQIVASLKQKQFGNVAGFDGAAKMFVVYGKNVAAERIISVSGIFDISQKHRKPDFIQIAVFK